MNYFKITLAGESEMSHDEIAEHLGTIMDFAEQTIHGEIGILTYSPTDEHGETIKSAHDHFCGTCRHYLGGGDFGTCCDQTYSLKYKHTKACEKYDEIQ